MSSTARGAEEEVFETPYFAEDDLEQGAAGKESGLSKTANKVPDAEVVSSVVPPHAAFEVFMGRTYAGAREDMSDVVGTPSAFSTEGGAVYEGDGYHLRTGGDVGSGEAGASAGAAAVDGVGEVSTSAGAGAGPGPRRRTGESPMQRLVRLREETAMLAEDLEEMSKARRKGEGEGLAEGAEKRGGGDGASSSAGGYQLWSAMAKETEALKRQLAQLSGDPRFKQVLSPSPAAGRDQEAMQQRLSEGVLKALERLREPADVTLEETASVAPAPPKPGGETAAGSVTYELFLAEAAEARRRFGAAAAGGEGGTEGSIPGAEARIAALEKALGGTGEGRPGSAFVGKGGEVAPLTEVVASLERRVSILEPGRLDALRQKAQLAKAELDSLAKSRSSSTSGSSSSASRNKKVEEAFTTLETWQEIAAGLPALVDRLRALETLHLASASFAQRLEQVEAGQTELEGVLKSTSESLDATLKTTSSPAQRKHRLLSAAFRVVLVAGWITPLKAVKELQLTSPSVCRDCREATGFHVRVTVRTPCRLWTDPSAIRQSSRTPRRPARTTTPTGDSGYYVGGGRVPPIRAEALTFGEGYDRTLRRVALPPSLKRLSFGERFNRSVGGLHLPPTLVVLRFGCHFNQPLDGLALPASLRELELGRDFNQPLDGISWNVGLQVLFLGTNFDKPLSGVAWPSGLRILELGGEFNQPVECVALPDGLEFLRFSREFNQPVREVRWPPALRMLQFGNAFDQPVAEVKWPPLLKCLGFGGQFRQSMENVDLPQGLEALDMGRGWNDSLAAFQLPGGLEFLFIGDQFDQPLDRVRFPQGLFCLSVGDSFNQPLDEVLFPPGLEILGFGDSFDQSLEGVKWPGALKEVYFGRAMDEAEVNDADWPCESLKSLVVGDLHLVENGEWLVDQFCC
eukprot:g1567.t1